MSSRTVLVVFIFAVSVLPVPAYAGKVELTTYYPAPNGEYSQLQSENLESEKSQSFGACIGQACTQANSETNKLKVMGSGEIDEDLSVAWTVETQGLVIVQGRPTTPRQGQMWIE